MLTILFQLALTALVLLSFVLVIGTPVALATPQTWDQSRRFIFLGSGAWTVLVIAVGLLNYLVA